MSIFGDEVDAILQTPKLGSPRSVDQAASRVFNTGGMARMSGDPVETSPTFTPPLSLSVREKYLEAAIGALLERQATFGALLRYPRVVVVGPRGSFACMVRTGRTSQWSTDLTVATRTSQLYMRDVDVIIWIKHCDVEGGNLLSGISPPTIEINAVFFDQANRQDTDIPASFRRVVISGSAASSGFDQDRKTIKEEYDMVAANLGLTRQLQGAEYRAVFDTDAANMLDVGFIEDSDGSNLAYVKTAVQFLEHVMRTGEVASGPDDANFVSVNILHNAVLAGVIPYAEADLRASRSDATGETRHPAPPPGEVTVDRLVQVMGGLLGYTKPKPARTSTSHPMSADLISATGSVNPYALAAAPGTNPYALAAAPDTNPYAFASTPIANPSTIAAALVPDDMSDGEYDDY